MGGAEKGYVSIYTASMRLVRQYHFGPLSGGRVSVTMPDETLTDLAPGVYYLAVKGITGSGRAKNSKVEKLIVIR